MTTTGSILSRPVSVSLFDGQVCDQPGRVIGMGINSKGEQVFIVEMDSTTPKGDQHVGKAQVEQGKAWVLSVYPEEIRLSA